MTYVGGGGEFSKWQPVILFERQHGSKWLGTMSNYHFLDLNLSITESFILKFSKNLGGCFKVKIIHVNYDYLTLLNTSKLYLQRSKVKSIGAYTKYKLFMGLTSTTFAQQCAGQILFYTFASSSAVLNASTLYYSTTRCTSRRQVRLLHFPLGRRIFPFPTEFFRAWYLRCFKESLAPHMTGPICCLKDVLT